jgi:hypothetical protein
LIGQYDFQKKVGQGAYGVVFKVIDKNENTYIIRMDFLSPAEDEE